MQKGIHPAHRPICQFQFTRYFAETLSPFSIPFSPASMPARPFLIDRSQAGCFHVVNRIYVRKYLLDTDGKDLLIKLVRAYEAVCGVEVLT